MENDPQLIIASIDQPVVTIDLTNDTSTTSRLSNCSKNKLKKYIKINRYIKKTQRLLRQNKLYSKKCILNKINVKLVDKLNIYATTLENNKLKYDNDTQILQLKIQDLEESLQILHNMQESSQKIIDEYSLGMDALIGQLNYNLVTFQSLADDNTCVCQRMGDCPATSGLKQSLCVSVPTQKDAKLMYKPDIIMYCDEIGSNMGSLLNSYIKGHSVISNCLPQSNLETIQNQILKDSYIDIDTTLLILVGNRGNVNKNKLIKFYETLDSLSVKKIILFTFPYCKQLSQVENDIRHNLNVTLYNMCIYNKKIDIIDTNNYVSNYYILTKGKFYLTYLKKKQIAMSLSYLFDISAKNLAPAAIQQPDMYLEFVPITINHLN